MQIKTISVAAALVLGLSGAALAQSTQPGAAGASDPAMRSGQGTDRSMNRMDPNTMPGSTGSTGREGGMGNMGGGTGASSNTGVGMGNQGANQGARQ
ncbi:hypothetical protein [Methylobacterium radiodurans]|uniref:Uncharacterized protein n=1 Tax=Methylobacterium radiodurans TaxID=2202828 RepID=A0A2U8VNX3_9HYPH|nr:hypothetical protein [Methylobacterium radiodurans]AWN35305.1 hypothetical protein DK427_05790 [Methylobacterium radiodurans]